MRGATITALVVACGLSAFAAGVGGARTTIAALPCPADPKTQPLGQIYGKNRGSTFCNDGARAAAVVGKVKMAFTGGVCWKSKTGFDVAIGTVIPFKRKASEPPGFWLQDAKPGSIVGDTVDAQRGTLTWNGTVTLKQSATKKTGTFSGRMPKLVNGKLSYVNIAGSYTCKRILNAPEQ